jgi:beta-fructofuranosidase
MNYGPLDHSNLHAPSTLCDDDGRRIAVFNVREGLDRGRRPWEGWTEVLSLPRVLGVDGGGLTVEAPAELATLRENRRDVEPGSIPSNGERILAERAGASIEVAADIAPGAAAEVGLTVLRSPDGEETTRITYWSDVDALGIDTAESTLHEDSLGRSPEVGPLELGDGERLRLRVFVDRSIVEVFANGRQCLTTRVYPERADSVGVAAFAGRGRARLESVDVWEMRDVWQ